MNKVQYCWWKFSCYILKQENTYETSGTRNYHVTEENVVYMNGKGLPVDYDNEYNNNKQYHIE